LTELDISAIIPVMSTELGATIPDEAPLSLRALSTEGETLLCDLLGFVQANDGFADEGAFDFYAYGRNYVGHWKLTDGIETIDMTRHSEDAYDHVFVKTTGNPKRPYQIAYTDYLIGKSPRENTYGALRGGQGILRPPTQQAPEA
jgi:hypothetical protein